MLGPGPASDHLLVAVDDPTAFTAALAANAETPPGVAAATR
jgi:hypothetical protein